MTIFSDGRKSTASCVKEIPVVALIGSQHRELAVTCVAHHAADMLVVLSLTQNRKHLTVKNLQPKKSSEPPVAKL